jgi:hypothetical protein
MDKVKPLCRPTLCRSFSDISLFQLLLTDALKIEFSAEERSKSRFFP